MKDYVIHFCGAEYELLEAAVYEMIFYITRGLYYVSHV
jgi:hypothetical protein